MAVEDFERKEKIWKLFNDLKSMFRCNKDSYNKITELEKNVSEELHKLNNDVVRYRNEVKRLSETNVTIIPEFNRYNIK